MGCPMYVLLLLLRCDDALSPETTQVAIDASRSTLLACRVESKRQVARTLCFLSVAPATTTSGATWVWGRKRARVQLICGKSLETRLGAEGLAQTLKRVRVGSRLIVEAETRWKKRRYRLERWRQWWRGELDLRCISLEILPALDAAAAPLPKKKRYLALDPVCSVILVDAADTLATFDARCASLTPKSLVGLDAEWEDKVALIQVAIDDDVYVLDCAAKLEFDLSALGRATLVGFGLDTDVAKIREAGIPISVDRSIELRTHPRQSLSSLARDTLGLPLDKRLQRSRWGSRPLADEMLTYAALDARVLLEAYRAINDPRKISAKDIRAIAAAGKLPRARVGDLQLEGARHPKDLALLALDGAGVGDKVVVDYNRRSGLVRVRDASVCFVNFGPSSSRGKSDDHRKYPNALELRGDTLEITWWPPPGSGPDFVQTRLAAEPVLLFARVAKHPYVFCGRLAFSRHLPDDDPDPDPNPAGGVVLALLDTKPLLDRRSHSPVVANLLDRAAPPRPR
ncbi:hypothetical protein CTAYLR_010431 [Chrysophaeum taylorii]|uniref:3'-5' exonuclease domain-containing protein n=1 Tax=Chrysophaeum taylorii TaxID=2483200 RepID=A0AAD7XJR1_9STRA|nr:hypothetical protein CTAYLR_010431 [Chrysophaeum taylorii]